MLVIKEKGWIEYVEDEEMIMVFDGSLWKNY